MGSQSRGWPSRTLAKFQIVVALLPHVDVGGFSWWRVLRRPVTPETQEPRID
jgi:hypothetical protein